MNSSQDRWSQPGSVTSIDGAARNSLPMGFSETRHCRQAREQSRKDMHSLNEKLASHLEKMQYIYEQNRKLMGESAGSKGRHSKETEKLRQTYDSELRQLRQLVDDCEREKAESLTKMANLQQNLRSLKDQIDHLSQTNQNLSEQLDRAMKEISDVKADSASNQRHRKAAEDEVQRLRAALDRAEQNNKRLQSNLDEESASRMSCQAEMQTLREEMEFQRTVHEQELDELRSMNVVDHEQDRDQWRNEMQQAIHDIQNEYDKRLNKIKNEMEANYTNRLSELSKHQSSQNGQLAEVCEENSILKNNLEAMRKRADNYKTKCERIEQTMNDTVEESRNIRKRLEDSLQAATKDQQSAEESLSRTLNELAALADAKLDLETEIAAYRRLLEAQDSIISNACDGRKTRTTSPKSENHSKELRVRVPSYASTCTTRTEKEHNAGFVSRWTEREEPSGQSMRSQVVDRNVEGCHQLSCSYSDSERNIPIQNAAFYRGQLTLSECAEDGSFIEMSNKGSTVEQLAGWCIIRNIDHGKRIIRYTFPDRKIYPQTSLRIWATGHLNPRAGPNDFEAPYPSWGIGNIIHTTLYSPDGAEKATHMQRIERSP